MISTIFLSILILIERNQARHWLLRFFAPEDRSTMDHLASTAADKLGGYVRGQLLIMTVTGTGSAIGLTLLGVPFALALGTLAFLTEAIPIAGPILAGAVMVGVALLESPAQALGTLVLVLALQQIEGLVLVPQIQGRVISISPAVALVSVIAGSTLAGIIGALIAIPLVAIVTVVVEEVVLPWRRRDIRPDPGRKTTRPPPTPRPLASRTGGKRRRATRAHRRRHRARRMRLLAGQRGRADAQRPD